MPSLRRPGGPLLRCVGLLSLSPRYVHIRACCRACGASPCPFSCAVSVLLCRVPSLMLHPLSHAASILLCRVFTPTRAASTPLPLAYPSCIDVPTSVHRVGCLSTPLHCMLCSACIVPPPPPTPLPHLMCASVRVSVQLCTCYFTCLRIRL